MGFPGISVRKGKNLPAMQETQVQSLDQGRSPGEGSSLQYSCLGNAMDRGAWRAIVDGVARVEHDLATKPPPNTGYLYHVIATCLGYNCQSPQSPVAELRFET